MKTIFTHSTKMFTLILLCLFASITNGYSQDIYDGDYCPAPGASGDEYSTGTVFSKQLSASPSSTCQIGTIHAKVDTQNQVLRLGMNIGNGGSALFRLYLDTDNNPLTGLTSDTFGGSLSVAGAEYILEINANGNGFTLYTGSGSTKTIVPISNGLAAKNGSAIGCNAGGGQFLEFNIPFGSIGINICDVNNPGLINITKFASVSGNSASSSRCVNTSLTFGIPLKGAVESSSTVCSGTSSILTVTGITGSSTITKWQSAVSPFSTWIDIPNTAGITIYTTAILTQTTKFRAIFSNSGLCAGNEITTSEATIIVNPLPTASISGTIAICKGATAPNVTFTGAAGTTPYTFTYNINGGTNTTVVTTSGSSITVAAPTGTAGTFNYNLVSVKDASSTTCSQAQTGTATIIITATNTAGAASSTPTLCVNTALTAITYTTTGATGIGTVTGLPTGVTAAWASNVITISGTPTVSGTFNYSVQLIGGCGSVNATGTITVTPANTTGAASSTPTLCISTALTTITHATTGATGIGTVTGLPTGVTAAWTSNVITISGTPTISGTFNYSILLTGGCETVAATGTITVNPLPQASAGGGSQTICSNATATVSGATA
ncbi:hypothetical protein FNW52_20480, partial [Flavobacterium sp. ZT3R18]